MTICDFHSFIHCYLLEWIFSKKVGDASKSIIWSSAVPHLNHGSFSTLALWQKQLLRSILYKLVLKKNHKLHKKTPLLNSLFIKVTGFYSCIFFLKAISIILLTELIIIPVTQNVTLTWMVWENYMKLNGGKSHLILTFDGSSSINRWVKYRKN